LDAAVAQIGRRVTGVQGDISVMADLDRLYKVVKEKAGHIDILHANAAFGEFNSLEAITEEHFDKTFDTNVKGTIFTIQKALPLLKDGGSVILTGSLLSIKGTPAFSIFSATKAALRNFARSAILDLKPRGIRVNMLSPGFTRTPGALGLFPPEHVEGILQQIVTGIPSGRTGEPDDIAKAALFLASDDSSFVNGIELFVDGGTAQI
jgi:NAD(P)-dependent dehydrogenase (short-subunit alcohol dehydrogenase family)